MIEFKSQAKSFGFELLPFLREIVFKDNLLVKMAQDELSGIKLVARKSHQEGSTTCPYVDKDPAQGRSPGSRERVV